MFQTYSYQNILAASAKIDWQVEDLIGGDKRLDFDKRFLPEALARVSGLTMLSPTERRTLNQIRAREYLAMFGLVEEFILPFVLDHARKDLDGDDYRVRALLQFAGEEAKHIHLFKRFCEEFDRGFGSPCAMIGPPSEIAKAVLAHDPLAVALTILHIEWMTQSHYVDGVKNEGELDPVFQSLLCHHWMEEAQHAKLDTLMVEALADGRSPESIARTVDEYLEIGAFLDGGLTAQLDFNLQAFETAIGRRLPEDDRRLIAEEQQRAMRYTYLGSGMAHPKFLATLERLSPALRRKIEEVAPAFS